jgi:hypothetical protein
MLAAAYCDVKFDVASTPVARWVRRLSRICISFLSSPGYAIRFFHRPHVRPEKPIVGNPHMLSVDTIEIEMVLYVTGARTHLTVIVCSTVQFE